MKHAILVHYAEIGLKAGNRHQFERRLGDRLRNGLEAAGVAAKVSFVHNRFSIQCDDASQADLAMRVVTRIPGVANASPTIGVATEIEAIKDAAVAMLRDAPDGTFKVETKRAFKGFPMTSIDISRAVAGRCVAETRRPVDVHDPDVTVRVHVMSDRTMVGAKRVQGPGGLPVGSTSRLLGFLSGGLDSPVAIWKMMRRGARVSAVHFHNRTHEGTAVLEKLEDLCGTLAWAGGTVPLLVVPFEACQRAIVGQVPAEYRMIVYRRAMFRIAARIAKDERALGYVTGDSLGQVASQTAENLRTIHAAADLPVYAPLCGSDKVEITERARRIGTYDISIRPHDDCCSFLIADHPATTSKLDRVQEMEAPLDWDALVAEAFDGIDRETIAPNIEML